MIGDGLAVWLTREEIELLLRILASAGYCGPAAELRSILALHAELERKLNEANKAQDGQTIE